MASPLKKLKGEESPLNSETPVILPPETREKMKYYRKVGFFNSWNSLRYQTKNQDSLKSFRLNCRFENHNNLARFLRIQKTLTNLELPIYNQLRKSLRKQLPTLKCLRKIEISPSIKMSQEDLEEFGIEFGRGLPPVQEFYLNFLKGVMHRGDEDKDEGLQSLAINLGKGFKKQKILKLFSFNIDRYDSVTDYGIHVLASQMSRKIKALEHFILRIRGCPGVSTSVLDNVTYQIGKCKYIKKLTLDYQQSSGYYDGDEDEEDERKESSFDNLAKLIGVNLRGLTHLCLIFGNVDWYLDSALSTLAEQIRINLKSVEHLHLDIQGYGEVIDDEQLEILINETRESLSRLKILTLDFSHNPRITDESIKKLSKLIRNDLTMIEEVNLYFDDCENITPEGEKILKRLNRI